MVELKLLDVALGYQRNLVVENMTLEARHGEMLGLVGPNGCGKSTIIKALSRVILPHSGSIFINERNISRIPRIELARLLGVVPQIPLLPSTFTAFEIVLMGRNPHLGLLQHEGPKDMAIAWEAMEKTSTQHIAKRRIGQLSGGEIQSVVIARVLAQKTEAVLLDEHAQMMEWLKAAAPDLIWIETMGTVREARAAAQAAAAVGLPFAVSFVVQESGDLLSGEALEEAVAAVEPFDPLAIGVNCIPPRAIAEPLRRLRRSTARPLSAYAHIGNLDPIRGWSYSQGLSPAEYADCARRWLDEGASIVGGCCGTTPAHIRALNALLGQVEGPR